MGRGLRKIGPIGLAMLLLVARVGALPSDSSANSLESVSVAPPASGPFEQKSIRRGGGTISPTTQGRGAAVTNSNAWELGKMPLALGAVLLLILGMRTLGKKMTVGAAGGGASKAVQVLHRSAVSPRQQLILVRVGRRLVLVGSSGAEMNPLCQIDDPDEIAEVLGQLRADKSSSTGKSFVALFGKAGKEYDAPPSPGDSTEAASPSRGTGEDLTGLTERVRRITEQFQGS